VLAVTNIHQPNTLTPQQSAYLNDKLKAVNRHTVTMYMYMYAHHMKNSS